MKKQLSYPETDRNRNFVLGVLCMIGSGLGFACMSLFIRLAGPVPTGQKTFFRNAVVLLISLIFMLRQGEPFRLDRENRIGMLARSFFGLLGILCNFYAVDHLPIADASVLNKLSPFFAILFSFFLLKEKVNRVQIIALVVAFSGAVMVAGPGFANPDWLAYVAATGGGLFAGLAYTFVRMLTQRGVSRHYIIFFFALFSSLALAPNLILHFYPMDSRQWAFLLLAGCAAAVGQYGITFAYSFAPARQISIFDYSQVLFAALLSIFILGEIPGWLSWLGYGIIFTASCLLFIYNFRCKNEKMPSESQT